MMLSKLRPALHNKHRNPENLLTKAERVNPFGYVCSRLAEGIQDTKRKRSIDGDPKNQVHCTSSGA
ncbi:hypothetical protein TSAR_000003 [Trichomalopsis sarcophagae]|uniref:Uncharacterized protein n=1 Tax=Trichomalopsis sarcophagae TaxID=543379 RepID=A0A232FAQ1_9HYME|nr:hypothetical protein TSAR_000003 [Trichomalopsis sarcophagae]